jgi:hypothetical protein
MTHYDSSHSSSSSNNHNNESSSSHVAERTNGRFLAGFALHHAIQLNKMAKIRTKESSQSVAQENILFDELLNAKDKGMSVVDKKIFVEAESKLMRSVLNYQERSLDRIGNLKNVCISFGP